MKKSVILFTALLSVIVGSTLFVSCSNDDDDNRSETTEYGYIVQNMISDDVLRLYPDITATFEYQDGAKRNVKPVTNEIIDRYTSKKFGNVTVTFEGNLRADAVDDDKSYKLEFHQVCKSGYVVLYNDFALTMKGSILKEKYTKLSSINGISHTFNNLAVNGK